MNDLFSVAPLVVIECLALAACWGRCWPALWLRRGEKPGGAVLFDGPQPLRFLRPCPGTLRAGSHLFLAAAKGSLPLVRSEDPRPLPHH